MNKFLKKLHQANIERRKEWPIPSFENMWNYHMCQLMGEVGEVCNIVKKIQLEKIGLSGSCSNFIQLANGLADVIISLDIHSMIKNDGYLKVQYDIWYSLDLLESALLIFSNTSIYNANYTENSRDKIYQTMIVERCLHMFKLINIDPEKSIKDKFNNTSLKLGFKTFIQ